VCDLNGIFVTEDRLIMVVEHAATTESSLMPPTRHVSVLYASSPYTEWHSLFLGKSRYDSFDIVELIGIFFNHQLRHFDVTLKVKTRDSVCWLQVEDVFRDVEWY